MTVTRESTRVLTRRSGRGRAIASRLSWLAAIVLGTAWALSPMTPPVSVQANPTPSSPVSVAPDGRAAVSSVIFPAQSLPLQFSHVQHLTLPGYDDPPDCSTCHDRAAASRSSLDQLLPRESACATCHDIDRTRPEKAVPAGEPPARCDACHIGFVARADGQPATVPRARIPSPNLKFDHAAHMNLSMTCTQCHGDMVTDKVALATRDQLPSMPLCLTCHNGQRASYPVQQTSTAASAKSDRPVRRTASGRCITCHLAGPGGIVRTDYPSGRLAPSGTLYGADHDMVFRTDHRAAAQNNTDYCENCHKKRFCVDCHEGSVRPMDFHGNDYVMLHAIDARRATFDCNACHRQQTFCTGCHSRSGVSSDRQGGSEFDSLVPERQFHPAGWAAFDGRGPNHHSLQAQRNIKQCASCHREQFCVDCHGATPGTLRVNPHPAGWARSRRCKTLYARTGRMCLRCHVTLDEARCM